MISPALRAQILRLYRVESWKPYVIAKHLGVHPLTVRRALLSDGLPAPVVTRPSKLDPFIPYLREMLERYPGLTAARLLQKVRERGYVGCDSHFREQISRLRPRRSAEAYVRRKVLPAEEAQVDWASFGKLSCGRATRTLSAFVMVLSHSRMLFVRFFLGQTQSLFLRGHEHAFAFFGGVPKVLLYDNLKSAVLERVGDAIRFHPTLWDFSAHYGFEPRPVGIAKGNEKGRVERAIRYLRTSFFPARTYTDLADLNSQALTFCQTIAAQRRHTEDHSLSVGEVWERERPLLLSLPSSPFPTDERIEVRAGKTPYVRFDKNDYSIPHTAVRRTLTVLACDETVRIIEGSSLLAEHPRCYDQGQTIEQEAHIEALRKEKRRSREPLSLRRLTLAAPAAHAFLQRLGEHGGFLGPAIARLEKLLDLFGPLELQYALTQAQSHPVPDIHALQLLLDARQHQLSLPPPIGSGLPPDSPLRAVTVTPHPLSSYDSLLSEDSHEPR